ncbi:MAG TPA: efflux RND transporter periplasmic adaptor subunit [Candidatus Acidoferrum sp.]
MTAKKWIVAGIVLAAVCFLVWLWLGRSSSEADAPGSAGGESTSVPAAVVRAERRTISNTLTISGEFKPFQEVDVHAKVAGYIKKIYVDVGDHVKDGQTLAELEVPELAAQLSGTDAAVRKSKEEIRRAESDIERAQSAHSAAHSAYSRLKRAADSRAGLVAQQELDDSQAKDLEAEAQVSSSQAELSAAQQQLQMAEANQRQYTALSAYSHIVAPFAGVVTARYADTGALVAAGTSSSTQATPVVRLAQVSTLRLVLPIPESLAGEIHLREPVKVHVQALSEDIEGKVSRFSDSLDLQTRTMQTEIDFENRDGRLMPGMYAETLLSLREKPNSLTVPLEAVTRSGDDATVLAVNAQNILEERHVKLGLEDNSRVEVLSGLSDQDRVVIGNRSEFRNGQKIQPKEVSSSAGGLPGGK